MTSKTPTTSAGAALWAPLAIAAALAVAPFGAWAQEAPVAIPAPAQDLARQGHAATAVFAGGCFWGVQGVFQHVRGVKEAVSGYAGGEAATASYEAVSTGRTGHAEAVEVTYDPAQVSYGELLQVYFSVAHNPTQLNHQGPDHGTQYRSTIFVRSPAERQVAQGYIAQLDAADPYGAPVVTTVEELKGFYPAEAYHQDYLTLHPTQPYIAVHDLPKVEALQAMFPSLWSEKPELVGS